MNNIKFIAYHKTKKQLRHVAKIDFLNKEVFVLSPRGELMKTPWQMCDIELTQYTGEEQ